MTHTMKTGVCYYPEHWPQQQWPLDAARMKKAGLSHVRIGEFAWSRLEDASGNLHLQWLSDAIDCLHAHGLHIILGTPTATPPRWMLERYPDMLAVDENGRTRDFGSRRHYCFSHTGYLEECRRIVTVLAEKLGQHPGIVAWQTDNEYGCHSTSLSYSVHALQAFRHWCAERYNNDIQALNSAWGNVFWSMEYDSFSQIGLPVGQVTESSPAHRLAFWRFSTDQIRAFNQAQTEIIRPLSPGRDIVHNFMGNFVEFDHHCVSQDLDVATWDSYPLGFLTRDSQSTDDQQRYLRTGHPDGAAFHHDLYRGCCKGRWWVMEQQPGPVNWAPYNPSPLPGMVRLWGWEAFAHGAEIMSYFRWRQAPFAQEQTHTGLLLSNGEPDEALAEVTQLNTEIDTLEPNTGTISSDVALVFSYAGIAMQDIQKPGGDGFSALEFCQRLYSACRQWGLDIDIVSPQADLSGYRLILLCTTTEDDARLAEQLHHCHTQHNATLVLFPGTGSRDADYCIPDTRPPGHFRRLIDLNVIRSESLPDFETPTASAADAPPIRCQQWREHISSPFPPKLHFTDGWGFHYQHQRVHYINALPCQPDLIDLIGRIAGVAQLPVKNLGPDLRTRQMGAYRIAFNYGAEPISLDHAMGKPFGLNADTPLLIGERLLDQAQVALWRVNT